MLSLLLPLLQNRRGKALLLPQVRLLLPEPPSVDVLLQNRWGQALLPQVRLLLPKPSSVHVDVPQSLQGRLLLEKVSCQQTLNLFTLLFHLSVPECHQNVTLKYVHKILMTKCYCCSTISQQYLFPILFVPGSSKSAGQSGSDGTPSGSKMMAELRANDEGSPAEVARMLEKFKQEEEEQRRKRDDEFRRREEEFQKRQEEWLKTQEVERKKSEEMHQKLLAFMNQQMNRPQQ